MSLVSVSLSSGYIGPQQNVKAMQERALKRATSI